MADDKDLIVLDKEGNKEAVLENTYNVIVTGEINGIDTLEFNLPFKDGKRKYLENEKQITVGNDIYRIRTITDEKNEQGAAVTSVYAEAAFYDLGFSVKKTKQTFNADTADVPMTYALKDTGWTLGTVNVRTKRTWTSTEKNASGDPPEGAGSSRRRPYLRQCEQDREPSDLQRHGLRRALLL